MRRITPSKNSYPLNRRSPATTRHDRLASPHEARRAPRQTPAGRPARAAGLHRNLSNSQMASSIAPSRIARSQSTGRAGRGKLNDERKPLMRKRKTRDRAAIAASGSDQGFQNSLSLMNLPAKQVKTISWVWKTRRNSISQAMESRSAAKITKEFKSPGDAALAKLSKKCASPAAQNDDHRLPSANSAAQRDNRASNNDFSHDTAPIPPMQ